MQRGYGARRFPQQEIPDGPVGADAVDPVLDHRSGDPAQGLALVLRTESDHRE